MTSIQLALKVDLAINGPRIPILSGPVPEDPLRRPSVAADPKDE